VRSDHRTLSPIRTHVRRVVPWLFKINDFSAACWRWSWNLLILKFGMYYCFARINPLPKFWRNRPAGKISASVSFQSTSTEMAPAIHCGLSPMLAVFVLCCIVLLLASWYGKNRWAWRCPLSQFTSEISLFLATLDYCHSNIIIFFYSLRLQFEGEARLVFLEPCTNNVCRRRFKKHLPIKSSCLNEKKNEHEKLLKSSAKDLNRIQQDVPSQLKRSRLTKRQQRLQKKTEKAKLSRDKESPEKWQQRLHKNSQRVKIIEKVSLLKSCSCGSRRKRSGSH